MAAAGALPDTFKAVQCRQAQHSALRQQPCTTTTSTGSTATTGNFARQLQQAAIRLRQNKLEHQTATLQFKEVIQGLWTRHTQNHV
jgi:hypothetical protein